MKTNETEKKEIVLENNLHCKQLKYIQLSLQNEESTKQSIEYNKQHNYEYAFIADNLIKSDCVLLLIRANYEILKFNTSNLLKDDVLTFYHEKDR